MLRVGLTGGIGSGKTTVCKLFEQLGVAVYYADVEAKKLYAESAELQEKLKAAFGEAIYSGNAVNKQKLKELLLQSDKTAEALNQIVHPFVFEHYENWCNQHASHKYTLKEAAILFESGSYKRVQKVVGVVAPLEIRIERVMKRDSIDRKEVEARINRQWPQEKWLSKCHYIIENDGSFSLEKHVAVVHSALLNDSKTTQPFVF